jgi:hypothetical protein
MSKESSARGQWAEAINVLLEAAVGEMKAMTVTRPSMRGTGQIRYVVEKTQQGEVLSELRLGGKSKPFRCPKAVYEALAVILNESDRPLPLDEIMSALEKKMSARPAEHQVRTALRFWLHAHSNLIRRNRSRYQYQAVNRVDFLRRTQVLWASVRNKG